MGQTVAALTIVLGAVVALRLVLRLCGLEGRLRSRAGPLRVVATCALGTRQRLHVIEVEGERLLIGATDRSVSLLRRLPRTPETSPAAVPAAESSPAPRARRPRPRVFWRRLAASLGLPATALAVALLGGDPVAAQGNAPPAPATATIPLDVDQLTQPERISSTLEIVGLLTLLSVAPSILLMATCFTRVVIVLALLRQAVGIHQLPPNQVLIGLALVITLFVMAPVGERMQTEALEPYVAREIDAATAAERALVPVREFLLKHTREKDLELFVSLSKDDPPESPESVSMRLLLPAYILSELRTAFEIGFTVFLPFLIVDLVIASMLISMQMIVLPPMLISLPFKIMLFVLVDGWNLVVRSLVSSLA